ncbi:DUF1761 domain-containing protein [Candidatus Woesebacteria bacterium]|nr:DUF1761 domain-containing protein [Candidatus Woesebacteria bacterium]
MAILVCAVLSMVIGFVWYGPLFGKKWMELIGSDPKDKKAIAEMQKSAGPMYLTQFLLTLFQVYVFAYYVKGWSEVSGIMNGLWIWAAFIMPTIAGSVMWTNEKPRVKKERFLIQSGYQLVLFVVFGYILGAW